MSANDQPVELDLRGKAITTYIVSEAVLRLENAAVGKNPGISE